MSRIGKLPVNLPAGVTVEVSADNVVSVKGPLGTLSQKVDSDIKVEVGTHKDVHTGNEAPAVLVSRPTNQPRHRSLRKPEPYKGKGIKFVGEQLRRKAGKSAGAK